MTRLINADALIKKWENVHSKDISFEMAIIGATNDVKKAPTIDAIPVQFIHEQIRNYYDEKDICACAILFQMLRKWEKRKEE